MEVCVSKPMLVDDTETKLDNFPLMALAPEIISCIINHFSQNEVLTLRLVNKQMRNLVDELYGFRFNIYDETERLSGIRKLKCEKITVWKLILPLEVHLFDYPSRLRVIEIKGPVTESNLQRLISPCVNLEKFSIIRRANYPWILNLEDTPDLANLKKLRFLLLNCEESKSYRLKPSLPMMDCNFQSLTNFDIVKGFPVRQYSFYLSSILKFISSHYKTLNVLGLCMLPRRNLCFFHPDFAEYDVSDLPRLQAQIHHDNQRIRPQDIDLEKLCELSLTRLGITTQGYVEDIKIWSSLLENQSKLEEFRFDWSSIDTRDSPLYSGFPWALFETPIIKSSQYLVSIELNNICVISHEGSDSVSGRLVPINLSLFGTCKKLENLTLVNDSVDGGDQGDPGPVTEEEQSVVVNGVDLPNTLSLIRFEGLPMKTTDLETIMEKCWQLQFVYLKGLGTTQDLGITSQVIKAMGKLFRLKNLQLSNFNVSTPEKALDFQQMFTTLDIPYEGPNATFRLSNGSTTAYDVLKRLVPPQYEEHT